MTIREEHELEPDERGQQNRKHMMTLRQQEDGNYDDKRCEENKEYMMPIYEEQDEILVERSCQ